MMKNIVLTGFMGTGKTEVGRELARLMGRVLIDVDSEIEKAQEMSINQIFDRFGEEKFRELETDMIRKVTRAENAIISTGGGAVLRRENVDALRKGGILVCLTASPETILSRVRDSDERPLLRVANPIERIKELLRTRMPYYEKADIIVDTDRKTPRQIAEEILEKVEGAR